MVYTVHMEIENNTKHSPIEIIVGIAPIRIQDEPSSGVHVAFCNGFSAQADSSEKALFMLITIHGPEIGVVIK